MSTSGNGHKRAIHFSQPPRRVVSLVPSMTESMFDLGFGEYVVGITDYCIQPSQAVANLPRVGGTKNARLEDILALKPDLVLANQEENSLDLIEALELARVAVWVTFPKTVRQTMDVLWTLVGIYQSRSAAARLEVLEMTLDWAETSQKEDQRKWRYFCPIWQHFPEDPFRSGVSAWWMTFNQDTYSADLLKLFGGINIFSNRKRRYPLEADLGLMEEEPDKGRDTRYPRVTLEEICAQNPEVILLPSEPFSFNSDHQRVLYEVFSKTTAAQNEQILLVDGSLLTWHGTRLARALQELPNIFARIV